MEPPGYPGWFTHHDHELGLNRIDRRAHNVDALEEDVGNYVRENVGALDLSPVEGGGN
jgi:hypothetical protein